MAMMPRAVFFRFFFLVTVLPDALESLRAHVVVYDSLPRVSGLLRPPPGISFHHLRPSVRHGGFGSKWSSFRSFLSSSSELVSASDPIVLSDSWDVLPNVCSASDWLGIFSRGGVCSSPGGRVLFSGEPQCCVAALSGYENRSLSWWASAQRGRDSMSGGYAFLTAGLSCGTASSFERLFSASGLPCDGCDDQAFFTSVYIRRPRLISVDHLGRLSGSSGWADPYSCGVTFGSSGVCSRGVLPWGTVPAFLHFNGGDWSCQLSSSLSLGVNDSSRVSLRRAGRLSAGAYNYNYNYNPNYEPASDVCPPPGLEGSTSPTASTALCSTSGGCGICGSSIVYSSSVLFCAGDSSCTLWTPFNCANNAGCRFSQSYSFSATVAAPPPSVSSICLDVASSTASCVSSAASAYGVPPSSVTCEVVGCPATTTAPGPTSTTSTTSSNTEIVFASGGSGGASFNIEIDFASSSSSTLTEAADAVEAAIAATIIDIMTNALDTNAITQTEFDAVVAAPSGGGDPTLTLSVSTQLAAAISDGSSGFEYTVSDSGGRDNIAVPDAPLPPPERSESPSPPSPSPGTDDAIVIILSCVCGTLTFFVVIYVSRRRGSSPGRMDFGVRVQARREASARVRRDNAIRSGTHGIKMY